MKINIKDPPRKYRCGLQNQIEISDCGEVHANRNEQLTFVTDTGKNYDFAAVGWGFYATPSINSRLKREGFKTALVQNSKNQIYVMVVDTEKIAEFEAYLQEEKQSVIEWLDEKYKTL